MSEAMVLGAVGVLLAPGVITLLKGHTVLFALGLLLLGAIWLVAMFRLARPRSTWARCFYDEAKLQLAWDRYG